MVVMRKYHDPPSPVLPNASMQKSGTYMYLQDSTLYKWYNRTTISTASPAIQTSYAPFYTLPPLVFAIRVSWPTRHSLPSTIGTR